jgi:RNA polymerase sigma factor (sigma-70 family)
MRARERKPHSSDALEMLLETRTPEFRLDQELDRARLQEALAALDVMPRAVIFLKLREDMTNDEIAAHLGITRRMVKRHLALGYAELRARMTPE